MTGAGHELREEFGDPLKVTQRVCGQEVIDVGEGQTHAAGEGTVGGVGLERAHPYQGICEPGQAGDLAFHEFGIARFQTVRSD